MITLKELKERKQVKAKRIDYNFIEDAEIIKNFEDKAKQEDLQIIEKKQIGNYIEYVLYQAGECEHKFSFASWDNTDELKDKFLQDIIDRCDLPVIKSYRDNDFAYLVTDGRKVFYTLRLNILGRKRVASGVLTIRSKDYIFTDDATQTDLYGSELKASQIEDNKIVIKNDNMHVNVVYIMEL